MSLFQYLPIPSTGDFAYIEAADDADAASSIGSGNFESDYYFVNVSAQQEYANVNVQVSGDKSYIDIDKIFPAVASGAIEKEYAVFIDDEEAQQSDSLLIVKQKNTSKKTILGISQDAIGDGEEGLILSVGTFELAFNHSNRDDGAVLYVNQLGKLGWSAGGAKPIGKLLRKIGSHGEYFIDVDQYNGYTTDKFNSLYTTSWYVDAGLSTSFLFYRLSVTGSGGKSIWLPSMSDMEVGSWIYIVNDTSSNMTVKKSSSEQDNIIVLGTTDAVMCTCPDDRSSWIYDLQLGIDNITGIQNQFPNFLSKSGTGSSAYYDAGTHDIKGVQNLYLDTGNNGGNYSDLKFQTGGARVRIFDGSGGTLQLVAGNQSYSGIDFWVDNQYTATMKKAGLDMQGHDITNIGNAAELSAGGSIGGAAFMRHLNTIEEWPNIDHRFVN